MKEIDVITNMDSAEPSLKNKSIIDKMIVFLAAKKLHISPDKVTDDAKTIIQDLIARSAKKGFKIASTLVIAALLVTSLNSCIKLNRPHDNQSGVTNSPDTVLAGPSDYSYNYADGTEAYLPGYAAETESPVNGTAPNGSETTRVPETTNVPTTTRAPESTTAPDTTKTPETTAPEQSIKLNLIDVLNAKLKNYFASTVSIDPNYMPTASTIVNITANENSLVVGYRGSIPASNGKKVYNRITFYNQNAKTVYDMLNSSNGNYSADFVEKLAQEIAKTINESSVNQHNNGYTFDLPATSITKGLNINQKYDAFVYYETLASTKNNSKYEYNAYACVVQDNNEVTIYTLTVLSSSKLSKADFENAISKGLAGTTVNGVEFKINGVTKTAAKGYTLGA